jgi:hypothetical protein
MMTALQYRDRADLMDKAAEASSHEAEILQCRVAAEDWRWLARLADWQDAMLANGHPAY